MVCVFVGKRSGFTVSTVYVAPQRICRAKERLEMLSESGCDLQCQWGRSEAHKATPNAQEVILKNICRCSKEVN